MEVEREWSPGVLGWAGGCRSGDILREPGERPSQVQVLATWCANPSLAPAQAAWSRLQGRPGRAESSHGCPLLGSAQASPPSSHLWSRGLHIHSSHLTASHLSPSAQRPLLAGEGPASPLSGLVTGGPGGGVGVT